MVCIEGWANQILVERDEPESLCSQRQAHPQKGADNGCDIRSERQICRCVQPEPQDGVQL